MIGKINNIYQLPKLRIYVLFKCNFSVEPNVRVNMNPRCNICLAKIDSDIYVIKA